MLICRGTDARTDGRTDGQTDGRTENIYSIFRDKLLLLGEHVLQASKTYLPTKWKPFSPSTRFYLVKLHCSLHQHQAFSYSSRTHLLC